MKVLEGEGPRVGCHLGQPRGWNSTSLPTHPRPTMLTLLPPSPLLPANRKRLQEPLQVPPCWEPSWDPSPFSRSPELLGHSFLL